MSKRISLNLKEKCYLVALFGDVPPEARERLFRHGSLPAQAGPGVLREGFEFVGRLNDERVLYRKPAHPALS